ncbi:flagellar export protein FliJ [Photobacterium aphoticum]|uniref:Flagellar FliJ protein n=1 Tax=Photobacterium aphoticum TaxID=754436 RepID=A0A0J1GS08_9GAMM|nr:flagellar export protein FliJ [Photobacterium aphoticum]KLV02540.1 flagellar biogenesis protein [Photobacterium aphoticum]PSU43631.1 flagella biosynthesis chaperone FliJ [Photobacterium aphoticum]GHA47510.1 flagellar protein FliJ [Photobacterium aphoticum]
MSNQALALILERAKDDEDKASLALNQARVERENYYIQLQQIEQYRLDYCRQLSERGQQGLTASSYGHLQKFLNQLDETLTKQKQAASQFDFQVEQCSEHWHEMRKKRRSIEWLLEKKQTERQQFLDRQEQKMMDEFATLQFARRMSIKR